MHYFTQPVLILEAKSIIRIRCRQSRSRRVQSLSRSLISDRRNFKKFILSFSLFRSTAGSRGPRSHLVSFRPSVTRYIGPVIRRPRKKDRGEFKREKRPVFFSRFRPLSTSVSVGSSRGKSFSESLVHHYEEVRETPEKVRVARASTFTAKFSLTCELARARETAPLAFSRSLSRLFYGKRKKADKSFLSNCGEYDLLSLFFLLFFFHIFLLCNIAVKFSRCRTFGAKTNCGRAGD